MEEVIFSLEFHETLEKLVSILYEEEYFGFLDSSVLYVLKVYEFAEENVAKPISRLSPTSFQKFGQYFIKYKANTNTTWYIFFDRKGNRFLINHILNNHTEDFSELM